MTDGLPGQLGRALGPVGTTPRWTFAAMVAVVVIQCLLAILLRQPWMTADSEVYLDLAQQLSEGSYGWPSPGGFEPDALRPPGYPIILWFLVHGIGLPLFAVILVQAALYVACIVLLDRFLSKAGINAVWFRAVAVIYPFATLYSAVIMGEAWVMVAMTAVALIAAQERLEWRRLVLGGLIGGGAALIRSDMLFLPLLFAGVVCFRNRTRVAAARGAAIALVPLAAAASVLLPYALWNQANFGRFSSAPLATAFGNSLYLATWQEELGLDDLNSLYSGNPTPAAIRSGLVEQTRQLNASIGAPPMTAPFNPSAYPSVETQIASSKVFGQAALARIRSDPGQYARHVTSNIWRLWNTSEYPRSFPAWMVGAAGAVSGFVFLLGMAGAALAVASRTWRRFSPLVPFLLYPMIHLPLHTEARYTAAARPLLVLFAGIALAALVQRLIDRRAALKRPIA